MARTHRWVCSMWAVYSHLHLFYQHASPSADLWPSHVARHPSQLALTLADLPNFMSLGNFVTSRLALLVRLPTVMVKRAGPTADLCRTSATSPLLYLLLTGFLSCAEPFIHPSAFPGCLFSVRPFGVGFCPKPLKNLEKETASPLSVCLLTPIRGHQWGCRRNHLACPVGNAEQRPVLYAILRCPFLTIAHSL